jgi:glucose-6-phosphate 1-dehydrogenase
VAVLPTFDMLLFGGTGDLVTRKLLPALYRRCVVGQVSAESRVVGIAGAVRGVPVSGYLEEAEIAL